MCGDAPLSRLEPSAVVDTGLACDQARHGGDAWAPDAWHVRPPSVCLPQRRYSGPETTVVRTQAERKQLGLLVELGGLGFDVGGAVEPAHARVYGPEGGARVWSDAPEQTRGAEARHGDLGAAL
eukprot:CAMPEP_0196661024 /NCGR_PEP_ID=MMETSP1086-20130531/42250_1 /TAXON_ID=77921 /ORGANISM="Cyanoptyche  gloeocystis , Strain SAG4.97" /LENGTH=123 /DNA_ID=CAMNT_0041995725 /DNA_START=613 /DNA_END=984 /DNA_ORIENTATION=+